MWKWMAISHSSMEISIDSANFAVRDYLLMAATKPANQQICLCQISGSGSSRLNSCPDLNKSDRGRAEEFPQWDPESCYRFGSGPNCSTPMTWLVFFSVPAVFTSFIVWFQMNTWILLVHFKGGGIKGGELKSDNQSDKLSDCFCSSCKHSSCSCVPASAQLVSIGCYRSSQTPEPLTLTVNEPVTRIHRYPINYCLISFMSFLYFRSFLFNIFENFTPTIELCRDIQHLEKVKTFSGTLAEELSSKH